MRRKDANAKSANRSTSVAGPGSLLGLLELVASRHGERTVIRRLHQTAPFRVGPPSLRDAPDTASIIVQHVGPGLLPGDRLEVRITVESGARLVLRGQSGTRLYPCPPTVAITSVTRVHVHAGGSLAWMPGDLIPYRDARYRQETIVDIDTGGQFLGTEILTPGRESMDERDEFSRLDFNLRVNLADHPLLIERNRLEPAERSLRSPGRKGPYSRFGVWTSVGFDWQPSGCSGTDDPTVWAAGTIGPLTIARLFGNDADDITRLIHDWWRRAWLTTG